MTHVCKPGYDLDAEQHVFPSAGYGPAIDECREDEDGRLWAFNSEYETQVNFCPFCGHEAKVKVTWGS